MNKQNNCNTLREKETMMQDAKNQPEQDVETVDVTAIPTVFADTFEKFGVPVKGIVTDRTFKKVQ